MIDDIFHFLKFQEFIYELGKICFQLGKLNFEIIGNFMSTTEFLTLRMLINVT